MAHKHDVFDMESHFEINGSSRFVKETSETKLVVVQGDHNSEVITFKMPRYIDGHDMLLCDKVMVHYINVDTKTNDSSTDIYEVTDLELCEECGDVLTFTWTIEAPATKYAGTLAFVVKFECTEGDSVSYQWNTAKYSGINVLAGLDVSEDFVDKYSSVIKKWFNDMSDELKESATFNVQLQNNNSHYPDYANKTTLSQSDVDERFEIPQDGYIQIIVGRNSAHEGENEHNYVNVSVNINGEYRFAVADSSTGTSFQQSSALYPVRAGDAVATVVETDFTMVTCCFFPLRDFAGDGGLIENAVDKVIGEYMENNDTFAKQSVVNDHMQRTDDELQDINDSIDNLSKEMPINITYDGNTSGTSLGEFYKVSNKTYPVERLRSCNVTFSLFDEPIPLSSGKIEENNGIITVFFKYSDMEVQCIKVTQDGVYFLNTMLGETRAYVTSLKEFGSSVSSVKSWQDLEDTDTLFTALEELIEVKVDEYISEALGGEY